MIQRMTPTQPIFKHQDIQKNIHDQLQGLSGDYLTSVLCLEHVSRLTVLSTPASIKQLLTNCPQDRDQIYQKRLDGIIDSSFPEIHGWCT